MGVCAEHTGWEAHHEGLSTLWAKTISPHKIVQPPCPHMYVQKQTLKWAQNCVPRMQVEYVRMQLYAAMSVHLHSHRQFPSPSTHLGSLSKYRL